MNHAFPCLIVGIALCGASSAPALAQTPAEPAPKLPMAALTPIAPTSERKHMHPVPVRNVPPSLMAWWLDPVRNAEPLQSQASRRAREKNPLLVGTTDPKREFPPLPAGVERIVAIDPQNALLVFGTTAATAELEKIVAQLDQPLRQVEISWQFVQTSPAGARAFNIQPLPPGLPTNPWLPSIDAAAQKPIRLGRVRGDAQATLARLVAQNKAKIITAPRLMAIDNQTAELGVDTSRAFVVDIVTRGTESEKSVSLSGESGQPLVATQRMVFTARPTINADSSITLQLAPASILKLSQLLLVSPESVAKAASGIGRAAFPPSSIGGPEDQEVVFSRRLVEGALLKITIREGQTVALTGFTPRYFDLTAAAKSKQPATMLLLVTARIIRRADDNAKDDMKPLALQRENPGAATMPAKQ